MSGLDGLGWPPDIDFSNAPLPWRYREDTRDVVASDGSVVCKAGDMVADGYRSGDLIVALANHADEMARCYHAACRAADDEERAKERNAELYNNLRYGANDRAEKLNHRLKERRQTDSPELTLWMRGRRSAFEEIANAELSGGAAVRSDDLLGVQKGQYE
jgi:hypothetical protein